MEEKNQTDTVDYPSPFSPPSSIQFSSEKEEMVTILLFNTDGNFIDMLFSGVSKLGVNSVSMMNTELDAGVYFYKLITQDTTVTKRFTLLY